MNNDLEALKIIKGYRDELTRVAGRMESGEKCYPCAVGLFLPIKARECLAVARSCDPTAEDRLHGIFNDKP